MNRALLVCCIGVLVLPHAARAQTEFEVAPVFAYYQPIGHFTATSGAGEIWLSLPGQPSDLSSVAWGGVARVWFGSRLGAQLQMVGASIEDADRNAPFTPGGRAGPSHVQMLVATADALLNLAPASASYRAWLSGGLLRIQHGGNAYSSLGSPVNMGGEMGAGFETPVARHLHATVGIESLLYGLHVRDARSGYVVEEGRQDDLLYHAGLAWSWHQ